MPMTDRALVCFLALSSIALGQESSSSTATMVTAAIAKSNLISFVQPDYPQLAKVASIAGKVRAEIIVDESGNVASVKLISGHPCSRPRRSLRYESGNINRSKLKDTLRGFRPKSK